MIIEWLDDFGVMEMEVIAHECAIHFSGKYAHFIGRDWNRYMVPIGDIVEIRSECRD